MNKFFSLLSFSGMHSTVDTVMMNSLTGGLCNTTLKSLRYYFKTVYKSEQLSSQQ